MIVKCSETYLVKHIWLLVERFKGIDFDLCLEDCKIRNLELIDAD